MELSALSGYDTPATVTARWADRIRNEKEFGSGFLCRRIWIGRDIAMRYCPYGLLMDEAEKAGVVGPSWWIHGMYRAWKNGPWAEFGMLTPAAARWAGIRVRSGVDPTVSFTVSDAIAGRHGLLTGVRYSLSYLSDRAGLPPVHLAALVSSL